MFPSEPVSFHPLSEVEEEEEEEWKNDMRLEALPSVVFILLLSLNMWFVNGEYPPFLPSWIII